MSLKLIITTYTLYTIDINIITSSLWTPERHQNTIKCRPEKYSWRQKQKNPKYYLISAPTSKFKYTPRHNISYLFGQFRLRALGIGGVAYKSL